MSACPGFCPYSMRPTCDGTLGFDRESLRCLHRPADREWRFRFHNRGVCPTVLDGESITTGET
eukprot:scaffold23393_cov106-Skeletonema_dohrnii-CCMP3373.AAC.1